MQYNKFPYFEYKYGSIVYIFVLPIIKYDLIHVKKYNRKFLKARIIHQTKPKCVTSEFDGLDVNLLYNQGK